MRYLLLCLSILAFALPPSATYAAEADPAYKGVWLSTPYPSFSVSSGEPVRIDVKVHNAGLPPQRVELSVPQRPDGWDVLFVGNERPIKAVFVDPDGTATVQLRIEVPDEATTGTHRLDLAARGSEQTFRLPIDITFGETLPAKLAMEADFPALKGTARSTFKYKLTLRNESGQETLVSLNAEAPAGFEVSFKEQYGTQYLTSLPLKPGDRKVLEAEVNLPQGTAADTYTILAQATAGEIGAEVPLTLRVTGRPELSMMTPAERLNGQAYAGKETPIDLVLRNRGSAPARDVTLSSSEPSGWRIAFEPERVDELPVNGEAKVKALITPSDKAIAGDYRVSFRANSEGASNATDFRVTVRTSSLWGIVGVVVIAIALMVLVLSVIRYGRR